ncbi:exportin-T [Kwoniella pini CBS 10737]|uniref:Exportin-T n=1 Tax=Kwoniella pini CBS 10737 TaxID=1296096 RepID=A0AAJ8MTC0_9TREE
MASSQSPHLTNIPEAVRIAAGVGPVADPEIKQQAIDYLNKVKELSQETWQDCLALYLQGAGAPGPSTAGKDGKEKLSNDLRMFCQQVVDTTLTQKGSEMTPESQKAMYSAVMDFVQTEYVQGPSEGGQAFLRNKLAFTIAHLFLNVYPNTIPTFLHPLFALLTPSSSNGLNPTFLTIQVLTEIAQEVHDTTLRSARRYSKDRQERDGVVRDVIRSSGDERIAVEGMLGLIEKGLEQGEDSQWLKLVEATLRTMVTWTPWVDLSVSLSPSSLSLYHRILRSQNMTLRTAAANIMRSFAAKGIQDPQARLEVLKVLDVVSLVDPLESETRGVRDNEEVIAFRAAIGGILATFGTELVTFTENYEVPISVAPFASDILRVYKRIYKPPTMPPPTKGQPQPSTPPATIPLTPQRREFLSSMLDILIRQLAWPEDAEWEAPGTEEDSNDDLASFLHFRTDVLVINANVPQPDSPDDNPLTKATTGKTYAADQLYLFEAAGFLVYLTKTDPNKHITLLETIAGPLMSGMASGVERYRAEPSDLQAVLQVHHHLMALGHFAKGFPTVSDSQVETLAYTPPFKQMTEALLQALDAVKSERVVRDAARFAFAQFVNAIGTTVAELVPRFVSVVVTEYEPSELVDFMLFLGLLMHRLKKNTFETMDMLLLPLLSRIFAILQQPITGTDEAQTHARLKDAYLTFFTALMNANLDGIFITERNKPEFENLLTTLLTLAQDCSDPGSQRFAFGFFARSVIAWGTSPEAAARPPVFAETAMSNLSKAVANGNAAATNQHAIAKEDRAKQALPGYENFIYQRLLPACFEVPAQKDFKIRSSTLTLHEMAGLVRSTAQARGQEAIDYMNTDLLPRLGCPPNIANEFINKLKTQQARDFRKTFIEFVKAMRG